MNSSRLSLNSKDGKIIFPGKFNPSNPEHIDILSQELNRFDSSLKDMKKIDKAFGIPTSATMLLLVMNSFYWGAIILASLYFGNRSLREPYQESLDRLAQIYNWCSACGIEVTENKAFLELAKIISPFMTTKELLSPWHEKELSEVSDKFKKIILEKNPNVKFNHKTPQKSFFEKLFGANEPEVKAESPSDKSTTEDSPDLTKAYKQFGNVLWFHFYGHKPRTKVEQRDAAKLAGEAIQLAKSLKA